MKLISPLRVYLDSSDYSDLSDVSKVTAERNEIRERLLAYARTGDVEFRYSATHVCELAPVTPDVTKNAVARTELMVKLCGAKCFKDFHQVIKSEKEIFAGRETRFAEVLSESGDWFPEIEGGFELARDLRNRLTTEFQAQVASLGTNRKARRLIEKQTIKNGILRPGVHQKFLKGAEGDVQEILRKYPMREDHALTLSRFIRGQASEEQAKAAFLSSLRDPVWMTRWFTNNFDRLNPVGRWFRAPSEDICEAIKSASEQIRSTRLRYAEEGLDPAKVQGLDGIPLVNHLNGILLRLSNRLEFRGPSGAELHSSDLAAFRQAAPGTTAMIEVLASVAWASVSVSPRIPRKSDFIDTAHAMYAPYVDIFRADSFMAPYVRRAVRTAGTTVVGNLTELIPAIELKLKDRAKLASKN